MERRNSHQRRNSERRKSRDRRNQAPSPASWQLNDWRDQRLQYQTRYLLAGIGLLLFNQIYPLPPRLLELGEFNLMLGLYLVITTLSLLYARRHPERRGPIHFSMWVDIAIIALVVINDPMPIPLTSLTWVVIIMGNGMRYGMPMFREGLVGGLLFALPLLGYLATLVPPPLDSAIMTLAFFEALILGYAYLLLRRIDQSHRQVHADSRLDPLTCLLNRLALLESAETLIKEARDQQNKLVVMFVDLNRFKQINDTFGHMRGDQVLCTIAAILRDNIRDSDLAARYGGDEFVLVLNETDAPNAALVGQRIQKQVGRWSRSNNYDLSLSIGIGEAPTHGYHFDRLLHKVDQAMYESKSANQSGGIAFVTE